METTKFNYDLASLEWDESHLHNKQNVYCYCGQDYKDDEDIMLQCEECQQLFHWKCVKSLKKKPLLGDTFYRFTCSVCGGGSEVYERETLSWVQVIYIVLYHLIRTEPDKKYFRWRENICQTISDNWDSLMPGKAKTATWHNTVAGSLSTHHSMFRSGFDDTQQTGNWTLHVVIPPKEARFKASVKSRETKTTKIKTEGVKRIKKKTLGSEADREILQVLNETKGTNHKGRPHVSFSDDESEEESRVLIHGKKKRRKVEASLLEDMDLLQSVELFKKLEKERQGFNESNSLDDVDSSSSLSSLATDSEVEDILFSEEQDEMDQDKYKDGKDSGDLSLSLDKPVSGIRDVDMEDNFDGGVDRSLEQQESKVVAVPVGMEKVDTDVDVKDKESLDTEIKMTVTDNADQQRVSSGGSVTREESSVQDKAPEDAMSVDEEEQEEEEEDDEESESESDEEGDEVDSSKVRIRTSLDNIEAAPLFTPSDSATDTNKGLMDMQKQWEVCAKISSSRTRLTSRARRLHRRLELRRFKRMLGLPLFDIDRAVQKSMAHRQVPWGERPVDVQAARVVGSYVDNRAFGNGMVAVGSREGMGMVNTGLAINSKNDAVAGDVAMRSGMVTVTAYANSFASRLMGRALLAGSLTSPVAQVSPFHGRLLRPFIWRDQRTFPTSGESTNNTSTSGMAMLHIQRAIRSHGHPLLRKQAGLPDACSLGSTESIDYVYFQKEHLLQVNALLCRTFWPGIDMSEALLYPEFSIVALYGRTVVGCAFLTPDAYLTFIAVCAGWEGAGIASFMVHHLTQTVPTKDVTLHVSATNPAMVLYQSLGFKPERFAVGFYKTYLPESSSVCPNAFFMRLRRY